MGLRDGNDELRRVELVLDEAQAARADSLATLLKATLAALAEHLGCSQTVFMLGLAEPPLPGRRVYAGVSQGLPAFVLEEYFERWADQEPLASDAARLSYARTGRATISGLYTRLDPPRRRFVDDFLRRTRLSNQLCLRLPVKWSDGYVTLIGAEASDEARLRVLDVLSKQLAELLRAYLPRGLDGLSTREAQVAELIALGFSNREIADVLHVGEDTVKKHVSHALAKLGMERRTELAVAWMTGRRVGIPRRAHSGFVARQEERRTGGMRPGCSPAEETPSSTHSLRSHAPGRRRGPSRHIAATSSTSELG